MYILFFRYFNGFRCFDMTLNVLENELKKYGGKATKNVKHILMPRQRFIC